MRDIYIKVAGWPEADGILATIKLNKARDIKLLSPGEREIYLDGALRDLRQTIERFLAHP